jgi:hypothetical protein
VVVGGGGGGGGADVVVVGGGGGAVVVVVGTGAQDSGRWYSPTGLVDPVRTVSGRS